MFKNMSWVPFWSKKKSLKEGPISQKFWGKKIKSAILEIENPFEMGPDLRGEKKKSQIS